MVSEARVKTKLPAILSDYPSTTKEGKKDQQRKQQALDKLRRHNPKRYQTLLVGLLQAAAAFDRELTNEAKDEIDRFNASFRPRSEITLKA